MQLKKTNKSKLSGVKLYSSKLGVIFKRKMEESINIGKINIKP